MHYTLVPGPPHTWQHLSGTIKSLSVMTAKRPAGYIQEEHSGYRTKDYSAGAGSLRPVMYASPKSILPSRRASRCSTP